MKVITYLSETLIELTRIINIKDAENEANFAINHIAILIKNCYQIADMQGFLQM